MDIASLLKHCRVIPVVTIDDARHAQSLARALLKGGVTSIEVTLRTPQAINAIKAIRVAFPDMIVGAGTVLNKDQLMEAKEAGAHFAVSPGIVEKLATAAKKAGLPYLPGAVTASEMMLAQYLGLTAVKFFPAALCGGLEMLKAIAPVFPQLQFCPTGGITRANMHDYLKLKNVIAVGGTWITPPNLIAEKNWDAIATLARQAMK